MPSKAWDRSSNVELSAFNRQVGGSSPSGPTSKRVNIKAILADPVKRKELAIRFIMSAQAMEGIDTTREQAEAAYEQVQKERLTHSAKRSKVVL